ncbi:unnamed protein product [Symbiodinium natans]|uniref:Uncharacterized protein n=1 Tax=Symbiodinium natans TaxID=878477 RepID=A0A812JCS6_9DINO|nr:unnamed protein product [Symbiodinium natans]
MVQASVKRACVQEPRPEVWPPLTVSHWAMQALWQLVWPAESHLPRLLAAQELGPMEKPAVPSSIPPEKLLCSGPPAPCEPANHSPLQAFLCHACGMHCGSSLQAFVSSQSLPQQRLPHTSSRDGLSRLDQSRRRDVKNTSSPSQALLCGHWCGQECVQHLHQASLMVTRPNFGRPPARAGPGDPDLALDSCRANDDLDRCSVVPWSRPTELPSLPSDVDMEDCNGCNRETTKPRFWDRWDADGLGMQREQMQKARVLQDYVACATPPESSLPSLPNLLDDTHTCPSPSSASHHSILHKPGTRSPCPARFVTFTVDERASPPAHPFRPLASSKSKGAQKKRSTDSGVLWHLIPGS